MTESHKCDDCKYDKITKRADEKCHYCRDWCNYVSVNKGKFFRRIALFYVPVVIGLWIILFDVLGRV